MNSTKLSIETIPLRVVWEICKFWILQNLIEDDLGQQEFERYVNFEFYKTFTFIPKLPTEFERYVNFEFYKTPTIAYISGNTFERYVNFEFYKTSYKIYGGSDGLRDM